MAPCNDRRRALGCRRARDGTVNRDGPLAPPTDRNQWAAGTGLITARHPLRLSRSADVSAPDRNEAPYSFGSGSRWWCRDILPGIEPGTETIRVNATSWLR